MADITDLFGEGEHLTPLQMSLRMVVMFFLSLSMITIMLGAVLARGVVGASPFWSVVVSSFILVLLHRLCAWLSIKNKLVEKIFKGESRLLYKENEIIWKEMERGVLSKNDLMEGLRLQGNVQSLNEIKEIYHESCGEISVVKNEKKGT
ncbi:MAG: DUF421 domain-containing protein [Chitinophagales bacterium]|nr:DUF421 domain-containing protein [Chitinophagales bacterium]